MEHIWGVPPETITKLFAADWTLDETAFAQYKNVLDSSNTLKETDLHALLLPDWYSMHILYWKCQVLIWPSISGTVMSLPQALPSGNAIFPQ